MHSRRLHLLWYYMGYLSVIDWIWRPVQNSFLQFGDFIRIIYPPPLLGVILSNFAMINGRCSRLHVCLAVLFHDRIYLQILHRLHKDWYILFLFLPHNCFIHEVVRGIFWRQIEIWLFSRILLQDTCLLGHRSVNLTFVAGFVDKINGNLITMEH